MVLLTFGRLKVACSQLMIIVYFWKAYREKVIAEAEGRPYTPPSAAQLRSSTSKSRSTQQTRRPQAKADEWEDWGPVQSASKVTETDADSRHFGRGILVLDRRIVRSSRLALSSRCIRAQSTD